MNRQCHLTGTNGLLSQSSGWINNRGLGNCFTELEWSRFGAISMVFFQSIKVENDMCFLLE